MMANITENPAPHVSQTARDLLDGDYQLTGQPAGDDDQETTE